MMRLQWITVVSVALAILLDEHELIDHGTATRNKLRCDAERMNA